MRVGALHLPVPRLGNPDRGKLKAEFLIIPAKKATGQTRCERRIIFGSHRSIYEEADIGEPIQDSQE
jgi:hypothetical protein